MVSVSLSAVLEGTNVGRGEGGGEQARCNWDISMYKYASTSRQCRILLSTSSKPPYISSIPGHGQEVNVHGPYTTEEAGTDELTIVVWLAHNHLKLTLTSQPSICVALTTEVVRGDEVMG